MAHVISHISWAHAPLGKTIWPSLLADRSTSDSIIFPHLQRHNYLQTYVNFFTVIGTTHIPTLVTGIISVIILVFIKFYLNTNPKVLAVLKVPIPAELLIVIFGTLISYLIGLDPYYGVRTIKRIPTGMPIPFAPDFSRLDVGAVMGDIFAIAVVTLCISITLGLLFANKNNYALDPTRNSKHKAWLRSLVPSSTVSPPVFLSHERQYR